eukprot:GHVU01118867.1.p7 GENE.GHVU01118867.1~~GHVU01118867.1.p7  ORF type:complete len:100 (+),score=7.37 GHVU01118867.1:2037-2336(+)
MPRSSRFRKLGIEDRVPADDASSAGTLSSIPNFLNLEDRGMRLQEVASWPLVNNPSTEMFNINISYIRMKTTAWKELTKKINRRILPYRCDYRAGGSGR